MFMYFSAFSYSPLPEPGTKDLDCSKQDTASHLWGVFGGSATLDEGDSVDLRKKMDGWYGVFAFSFRYNY